MAPWVRSWMTCPWPSAISGDTHPREPQPPASQGHSGSPGESAASIIRSVEQQAWILLMTITALVQVFPHLSKGAAIDWYFDLDKHTVGDWNMLKAAFQHLTPPHSNRPTCLPSTAEGKDPLNQCHPLPRPFTALEDWPQLQMTISKN